MTEQVEILESSLPTSITSSPTGFSPPTLTPRSSRWRLNSKKLFLTYPKASATLTVEAVLERCKLLIKDLKWCVVAREHHKDQTVHFHVAMLLSVRPNYVGVSGLQKLDELCGSHGNYAGMKSIPGSLEYLMKEGDFRSYGIDPISALKLFKENKRDRSGVWNVAAASLLNGKTLDDLAEKDPGFVGMNLQKLEAFSRWAKRRRVETPKDVLIRCQMDLPSVAGLKLLKWINENLIIGKNTARPLRTKQLWLWGPPGIGKTTFRLALMNYLRLYTIPNDEDFYDDYEDQCFDCAVFDEFKGQKKIQWMNSWLDGQPKPLRKKGSQYMKLKNVPTIILSNYSPEMCYHKVTANQIEPLTDRLTVLEWKKEYGFISVEFISEDMCSDYEKEEVAAGNWRQYQVLDKDICSEESN